MTEVAHHLSSLSAVPSAIRMGEGVTGACRRRPESPDRPEGRRPTTASPRPASQPKANHARRDQLHLRPDRTDSQVVGARRPTTVRSTAPRWRRHRPAEHRRQHDRRDVAIGAVRWRRSERPLRRKTSAADGTGGARSDPKRHHRRAAGHVRCCIARSTRWPQRHDSADPRGVRARAKS